MHGLVAFYTTPYVVFAVVMVTLWLTLQDYLSVTLAWIVGPIAITLLTAAQVPLYRALVEQDQRRTANTRSQRPISSDGCGVGLVIYAVCLVLSGIGFWLGGIQGGLIGVLLTPFLSFGTAYLITTRDRRTRQRSRR